MMKTQNRNGGQMLEVAFKGARATELEGWMEREVKFELDNEHKATYQQLGSAIRHRSNLSPAFA